MKISTVSFYAAAATLSVALSVSSTFAQSPSSTPGGQVGTSTTPAGEFLVDSQGNSLYVFASDTENHSNCTGDCETAWPPLKVQNGAIPYTPTASGDVQSTLLNTALRPDGSTQVTYAGQPLYLYAGDTQPGQTKGQGLNQFGGVWNLVKPDGQKLP